MILAQQGARVIKVEIPETGDDSRAFGPFVNGKSLYFSAINYDKKSIALNLKQPADREIFEKLLGIADVAGKYYIPKLGAFIVYSLMIAILIWRPQGLFVRKAGK